MPELKCLSRKNNNNQMASTSKSSKNVDSMAKNSNKNSLKTNVSDPIVENLNRTKAKINTKMFCYEIDCKRVIDSINVNNLVSDRFPF